MMSGLAIMLVVILLIATFIFLMNSGLSMIDSLTIIAFIIFLIWYLASQAPPPEIPVGEI